MGVTFTVGDGPLLLATGAVTLSLVVLAATGTACLPAWLALAVAILLTGAGAVATVEALARLRRGRSRDERRR